MSQSVLPSSLPNPTAARPASVLSRFPSAALYRLVAGLAILLFWEAIVRGFAPAYVAKPSSIIAVIPKVIIDPAFLAATGATLLAVAQGLVIAIIFGTVIGLLMGRSVIVEKSLRHYINGFYAVPMVVVLPLMSLWFGYTGAARLATIVFASLFSIIVNVADGAKAVPREYLEVARAYRSRPARMLFEVVLPSSV